MIRLGALNKPIKEKAASKHFGIADDYFLKGRPGFVQQTLYGNAEWRSIYTDCHKIVDVLVNIAICQR
jgi:hypothetical protein